MVKALTVVGFALPVVVYLVFLQHYQVNAMWQDQWDDVPVIRQSFRPLSRLVLALGSARRQSHFLPESHRGGVGPHGALQHHGRGIPQRSHAVRRDRALHLVAQTSVTAYAIALLLSCRLSDPHTCSVAEHDLGIPDGVVSGTCCRWLLTIALLDWPRLAWPIFALAIFVAVVGSFSSLQGLLIWPVGLVLLYHRRRPLWTAGVWVVAAGATTVLYFHNFTSSKVFNPNETILKLPFDAVKFFVFALGDVVGLQETKPEQSNGWVMAFGVVILVLAVLVLVRWGLRRDEHSAAPIGIALILYGLLFDALITQGRLFLLYFAASASRYTTNDVLVLAGIYLTALDRSSSRQRVDARSQTKAAGGSETLLTWVRRRVDQIDRVPLRQIALAAIVIQVVFSVSLSFSGAQAAPRR